MTHLETLIRSLPRQRRAFAEQRLVGIGILIFGVLIGLVGAVASYDKPLTAQLALSWVIVAVVLLLGGYRVTRAEILIAENDALLDATIASIEELRIARESSPKYGDMHRAIEARTAELTADILWKKGLADGN